MMACSPTERVLMGGTSRAGWTQAATASGRGPGACGRGLETATLAKGVLVDSLAMPGGHKYSTNAL
jgi:hypothetical protein